MEVNYLNFRKGNEKAVIIGPKRFIVKVNRLDSSVKSELAVLCGIKKSGEEVFIQNLGITKFNNKQMFFRSLDELSDSYGCIDSELITFEEALDLAIEYIRTAYE